MGEVTGTRQKMNPRARLMGVSRWLIAHWVLVVSVAALLVRIVLDVALWQHGYFYGGDIDTFIRVRLAWQWSTSPFFRTNYWPPLQFIIGGLAYLLVRPLAAPADPNVIVAINHIFFLGSLFITVRFTERIGGRFAALLAAALAITFPSDIWTTFSGLADPITVFLGLVIAYQTYAYFQPEPSHRKTWRLWIAATATLFASANHYTGWYFVVYMIGLLGILAIREAKSTGEPQRIFTPKWLVPFGISILFPSIWIAGYMTMGRGADYIFTRANAFHADFYQLSWLQRLLSAPQGIWQYEPVILVAGVLASIVVTYIQTRASWYLLPGITFLGLLTLSGLMAFGIPGLWFRYTIFVIWVLIPFVAALAARILSINNTSLRIIGVGLIVAMVAIQSIRAFRFVNYMNTDARKVAEFFSDKLKSTWDSEVVIMIERPTEFDPLTEIDIFTGHPITTWSVTTPTLLRAAHNADWVVLTNPMTYKTLASRLELITLIGDYIIAVPKKLDDNPAASSLPDGWEQINPTQAWLVLPDNRFYFGFSGNPQSLYDQVGIQQIFKVQPNGCYLLKVEIYDRFADFEPIWAIIQQLTINDLVLWSHDVAGDGFLGWQTISLYIQPTTDTVTIKLRAIAYSPPETEIDWGTASLVGFRNFSFSSCQ